MAPNKGNDGDWLASLARQSASTDNKAKPTKEKPNNASKRKRKGKGGDVSNADNNKNSHIEAPIPSQPLTKAQRIEKREQKKIQREDRKKLVEEARQQQQEARQQRLSKKRQKLNHGKPAAAPTTTSSSAGGTRNANHGQAQERSGKHGMTAVSKRALIRLSTDLDSTLSSIAQQSTTSSTPRSNRTKKNKQQETVAQPKYTNGLSTEPKGKATKHSTLRPDSKELQPRIRDYNGQGLVRPSLYLPFSDASFMPKVELEFEEHVPGFFGKSKTKAAKKQAGENMLWRRCLKAKGEEVEGG
eukprot:CAMPEP_0201869810 /NCGR_PEP_ID=MMETSP0902-20130614/3187_1 /ASSEMBLY_ACC=CAM_ASM_000551 /TAXON_ID=420261 /ORGANISM="Thalassiosira antarctica, Strain CCMP982" /LENGTH=299 /DNA_ID=CAMNT_0048395363 /DNA_START=45 /DNA_END=941 /DNA_ORIENTATION=-